MDSDGESLRINSENTITLVNSKELLSGVDLDQAINETEIKNDSKIDNG